jgi:hypothetical protein
VLKKPALLIKILFILVYCAFAAELFFRVFVPVPILPRRVCAMPYGIRGNKPNQIYWQITPECKIRIQTNSRGIRSNGEISYDKPVGVKRIVMLGDSFGMGYEVNYEDMFSTRMEFYLNKNYGIHAEVVNLSTSGHGNAEELIVLQNEGLKYNPDIVLLAWHATDYEDNTRSNLYGLKNGQLTRLSNTYLPAVDIREKLERIPLYIWMEENSRFYTFIREFVAVRTKRLLTVLHSQQQNQTTVKNPEVSAAYEKNLALALLNQIKTECEKNHIKFMILDIPLRVDRVAFSSSFPLSMNEAVGQYHIYNPIEDFKTANGQKIYWEQGHGHFTPLGCDIVGKGLADILIKDQLLN